MKQLYGMSFVTLYGRTPSALWVEQIAKLTDTECRSALTKLAGERRQYPANLTEFIEAARPGVPVGRFLGMPVSVDRMLAHKPLATRAHVDRCLANMREALSRRADEL